MKLNEMTRTGWSDPEDQTDSHSRSEVDVAFKVSFAHEPGLESAFAELNNHGHFQTQLEAEFLRLYKSLAQKMIQASSIPPGSGWMDDLECSASIAMGSSQKID